MLATPLVFQSSNQLCSQFDCLSNITLPRCSPRGLFTSTLIVRVLASGERLHTPRVSAETSFNGPLLVMVDTIANLSPSQKALPTTVSPREPVFVVSPPPILYVWISFLSSPWIFSVLYSKVRPLLFDHHRHAGVPCLRRVIAKTQEL